MFWQHRYLGIIDGDLQIGGGGGVFEVGGLFATFKCLGLAGALWVDG